MNSHWAGRLVFELRQVDRDEAPHGLYGLRENRRQGDRLPKLPFILAAPPIRLLRRIGVTQHVGEPAADSLGFGVEGPRNVLLEFFSYADTKVRRFGDTYRLDKQGEPFDRAVPDLKSGLARLGRRVLEKHGRFTYSFGLLFIGHFSRERDVGGFVDDVCATDFLRKHGFLHVGESWADVHGRDFWSTLHIWYVEQPQKA